MDCCLYGFAFAGAPLLWGEGGILSFLYTGERFPPHSVYDLFQTELTDKEKKTRIVNYR